MMVFAFQELMGLYDSTFPDYVHEYLESLSNSLLREVNSRFGQFELVQLETFGSVGLVVFVQQGLSRDISEVFIRKTSFGLFYSAIKGSVLISFKLKEESFTFVGVHLNANEGETNYERRNKDSWDIWRNATNENDVSVLEGRGHVFLLGDLNYRASTRVSDTQEIESGLLAENDELKRAMRTNAAFVGFKEADIQFKPSYKFIPGTANYDSKRTPSWCDRILYRRYDHDDESVIKYNSIPEIQTSDHIPVALSIKVGSAPSKPILEGGELIGDGHHVILHESLFRVRQAVGVVSTFFIQLGLFGTVASRGRVVTGVIGLTIIFYYFFS